MKTLTPDPKFDDETSVKRHARRRITHHNDEHAKKKNLLLQIHVKRV